MHAPAASGQLRAAKLVPCDAEMMRRPVSLAPEPLFMVGAVSQYLGAAVAAVLFDQLAPGGVALLRVLAAAAVIVALRRSWRRRWQARELGLAAAFGVSLAAMNLCFYLAMDRLPLGNAVAIEFTGPVVVAALGARTLRSAGALVLAVAGVLVLAGVATDGTAPGWGSRCWPARSGPVTSCSAIGWPEPGSVDGLGLGMLVGAVAISPFGTAAVAGALDSPLVLASGWPRDCCPT